MAIHFNSLFCVASILTFAATLVCSHEQVIFTENEIYRLPETVIPTLYNLSLTIDPDQSTYTGNMLITFDVSEEVDSIRDIYLHVDFQYISIGLDGIVLNNEVNCLLDSANEADILNIFCAKPISGTDNLLSITYEGKFSEDGHGFVRNTYIEEGEEQILVESYFKPIYARRAFPCLDEPDIKTEFSIEITYPEEYTAISNSPVLEEHFNTRSNLRTTRFETTPKISTYLVSIFISKFQTAIVASESQYDFKVFTRPEVVNLTNEVVGYYYDKIIDAFIGYTGVPYDDLSDKESYQVALPDYYSDSMGNFGLFTYRETDFLDEGNETSNRAKQNIILAMAYKLGHEWYGGDLTMKWWSDVWATESVAMYLKYIIPNQIDGDLELVNQFMVEVVRKAMQSDGMPYAQPLSSEETDINLDQDIENKLDADSYLKGASFLHTVNYAVGGEYDFQESLQYHWKQRAETDTTGSDLLKDIAAYQEEDALYSWFLEKWAFSAGYPIITARIYQTNILFDYIGLREKRFVYPMDNMSIEDDGDWTIPISSTDQSERLWNVKITTYWRPYNFVYICTQGDWIVFNLQGGCFYRVNYDDTLWGRLIGALKDVNERKAIHVLTRAQLVDDIFNIARIGDVSYITAFSLADFLVNENEYYPWYSAFDAFSYLLGKMGDEETEIKLQMYILNLMSTVVDDAMTRMGDGEETHIDVLKRVMVLDWACKLGDSECVSYAVEKFRYHKETKTTIDDNNLRGVILCNGIRHSDNTTDDWNHLWNRYIVSSSVHEQNDVLTSLGCVEDKDLLKSYLLKTITANSSIKRQDAAIVFKSVFSSSLGVEVAMEFLESNFMNIYSYYPGIDILSEMMYAVAEKLLTDEQIEWLGNILDNDIFTDHDNVRTKAKVIALVNNYWKNHFQDDVKYVFNPTTSTEPPTTTTEYTTTSFTTSTSEPSTSVSTTESSTSESTIVISTSTSLIETTTETATTELSSTSVSTTDYTSTLSATTEGKSERMSVNGFMIVGIVFVLKIM